ncbi:hypothetical protein PAXINDRAFT_34179, partial [Paxillus involutus ATCC 200175]
PHVQCREQAEIDQSLVKNRLPPRADEASLPYVPAVVKEVLRFSLIARLGKLPHIVLCEDVYLGYYIPHGSTVIANIW